QTYLCQADLVRDIGDSDVEFTEKWRAYVWAANQAAADLECSDRLTWDYKTDWMTPRFFWQTRNLTATLAGAGAPLPAVDAATVYGLPSNQPELPLAYGGPLGSKISWNPPGAGEASASVQLTDSGGTVRSATPAVKRADFEFAERTGLPDPLGQGNLYVPGTPHLRISNLLLELQTPFQLGADMQITQFYVENVGTIFALPVSPGGLEYRVPVYKGKLYLCATGQKGGDSAATSMCFTNTADQLITIYHGAPSPHFTLQADLGPSAIGFDMHLTLTLWKYPRPAAPFPFVEHQPFVALADKTASNPVTLTADTLFDGDGDIARLLWIDNFDVEGERYLAAGNGVVAPTLTRGDHQITAVVYDLRGSYATSTMTLTVANVAPVAANDAYSVDEDASLTIGPPGVLGNDTDANGDPLTIGALVDGTHHGSLGLGTNGSFVYTPTPNYSGPDSFTYRASDGEDNSNVATVSITVTPVNDPPVANGDSYTVNEDATFTVPAPGVLGNDTDPDSPTLTAALASGPGHGTLTLNANGSFTYAPAGNYTGPDSFTYTASDGQAQSAAATVALTVVEVPDDQEAQALADMVLGLKAAGAVNAGQANSLLVKINQIVSTLQQNKNNVACNLLKAFVNEVNSLVATGVLSPAQAAPLLAKAANLMAERGC
ncbi:MAG: repeat-containing protein, partial [Acidobacteria bacterium]|nr:repeat-containing protein [Acidobacteriota bacterium]